VTAPRFGVDDLVQFDAIMADLRRDLGPPVAPGEFTVYTDGACFGNPNGPGGWAAIFPTQYLWGHLTSTSNNRAEALGILAALEWVPPGSSLRLHSDSELSVKILQKLYKAKANPDIWARIFATREAKRLTVEPIWVRGHAGDPGNEMADRFSKLAARNGSLDDVGSAILGEPIPAPPPTPKELVGVEPQGDWERGFLTSVADQLRRKRPLSPKQQAIIERMRARRAATPGGT
jgi:ribonuclease HI